MSVGLSDLRGVKPTATDKIRSLAVVKFTILPGTVKCTRCSQRYLLMADFVVIDPAGIHTIDGGEAIQRIINTITSEHDTGHDSEEVTLGERIKVSKE